VRRRNEAENQLLDLHGDRIVFYELRGNLFFATADRLLEEMVDDLDQANWVIVHMRRVSQIDFTAIRFLHQIAARLEAHGGQMLFCNVHQRMGIGKSVQDALNQIGSGNVPQVVTFNGKDEALEYAEDALLESLECTPTRLGDAVPLERNELCRYFDAGEIEPLRKVIREQSLRRGDAVFAKGEHGNEMFIVNSGQVDIRLPTTAHHYKRLASCGPGSFFGELTLLKPGPRAADAIAVQNTQLLVLDRAGLDRLQVDYPVAASNLLRALCEIQVARLRWSSFELQRLSES
jgi:CRP-like cAMP-binding protein/anti-anti-sigma regulatory factor